ncbi:MAG: hypothetical protein AVDCRST_MAG50-1079, partial [uncultured Acidimicrobiales bacterium]
EPAAGDPRPHDGPGAVARAGPAAGRVRARLLPHGHGAGRAPARREGRAVAPLRESSRRARDPRRRPTSRLGRAGGRRRGDRAHVPADRAHRRHDPIREDRQRHRAGRLGAGPGRRSAVHRM